MHSSVHVIDYVVLVCYLLLMAGIGAYFMRFMRVGADFLKGGNRVEWWVAGMASFMSGFSVWTFTGGVVQGSIGATQNTVTYGARAGGSVSVEVSNAAGTTTVTQNVTCNPKKCQ